LIQNVESHIQDLTKNLDLIIEYDIVGFFLYSITIIQ
jgi:hypothetical protein